MNIGEDVGHVLALLNGGDITSALQVAEQHAFASASPARAFGQFSDQALAAGLPQLAWDWRVRSVALNPDGADTWARLGELEFTLGRWREAARSMQTASRLDPDEPSWLIGQARALLALGRYGPAKRVAAMLLSRFPRLPETCVMHGLISRIGGDRENAIRWLEAALDVDAKCVEALRLLAEMDPRKAGASRLDVIQSMPRSDDRAVAELEFALGRIREAQGAFAVAFRHYRLSSEAQQRMHASRGQVCQPDVMLKWRQDAELLFPTAVAPAPAFVETPSAIPIFIVGMPRTGTTLIETILGRHAGVATGGELDAANRAFSRFKRERERLGRFGPVDPSAETDEGLLLDARESYLEAILEYAADCAYVTDKHPGNAPLVGFLRMLFPMAPMIFCRRDPMATCWSLYSSFLPDASSCFRTFEGLSSYHRAHSLLLQHWRTMLRPPCVEICYETLVSDPATEIPRLVSLCGLSWDPDCMSPEAGLRPVTTASVDQVRRPIHRESVDRYLAYAPHIGELRAALVRVQGP
jgi:tetratricopeptide (TPR) repeat protein